MRATSFGVLAQEALQGSWSANVIGVTSGGVFILSEQQRVLFLTYSPFHSPSTINLEASMVDLRQNGVGERVSLDRNRITLLGSGMVVDLDGAAVWDPLRPVVDVNESFKSIPVRIERAALQAAFQKGPQGLAPGLKFLVGKGSAELEGDLTEKILASLVLFRAGIRADNPAEMVQAAEQIIGHGRGLTPAADDCIAGVLLSLNRWKEISKLKFDLEEFNGAMIAMARQKTTSLSATIIHAAALGKADERILRVLDGIVSGNYDESEALRDLVKMGHSSGVDALVGIVIALTA
jgi:hypothetical protein